MSRPLVESAYRYPEDWPAIAEEVRSRAGGRCECRGECANPWCSSGQEKYQRCIMQEVRYWPRLAVLALDHNPMNCGQIENRPNLRAFCQSCTDSYRYDLKRRPEKDPGEVPPRTQAEQGSLDL